jgi:hypothetical protein
MKTSHVRKVVVRVLGILVLSIFMIGAGEVMLLNSSASAGSGSCTPVGIMTYQGRVHVQCSSAIAGITYFAVSTADPAYAARVLNVITAAQALGRTVNLQFDDNTASNPSGCLTGDCRLITAVGFGQ